jgi:hypothetical protein
METYSLWHCKFRPLVLISAQIEQALHTGVGYKKFVKGTRPVFMLYPVLEPTCRWSVFGSKVYRALRLRLTNAYNIKPSKDY